MFNELDELLKLTKLVEATSTNSETEQPAEDLPCTVRAYEDGDYSGKATVLRTQSSQDVTDDVPQPPKDGKAYGSSGNATFKDKKGESIENGPLFEEDGPTDSPDEFRALNEDALGEGIEDIPGIGKVVELGKQVVQGAKDTVQGIVDGADELKGNLEQVAEAEAGEESNSAPADTECAGVSPVGNSLKRGLSIGFGESVEKGMGREFVNRYLFESGSGACFCRNNPFQLGDAVQVAGIPRIFIVKNTDGNMITTAKPTNCQADFAKGKDGVWPEYCFQQDELSKVDDAGLDKAELLAEFNDRDNAGFDGKTIDAKPMEIAQEYARNMTMDDLAGNLDEILGAYRTAASGNDKEFCYTKCSPVTTFVYPNGQVTTQCIEGGFEKRS